MGITPTQRGHKGKQMAPTSPALSVGTKEEVEVADNLPTPPPSPPHLRPASKTLIKCEGSSGGPKLRWELKASTRSRGRRVGRRTVSTGVITD